MADWYSSRCALTWKLKGTKFNRLLFQLQPKTHRTEEIDVGLLLKTPCSADAYTENLTKKEQRFGNSGTLAQEVQTGFIYQRGMLPTPSAMEDRSTPEAWDARYERKKLEGINLQMGLCTMARKGMLPTPNAFDWNTAQHQDKYQERKKMQMEKGINLHYSLRQMTMDINPAGTTSQLNPRFVAEMMGFPHNWTELPFQNGERKVSKDTATQ
jgi:hypothetical protein